MRSRRSWPGVSNVLILGVTVLTSLNDIALSEIGFRGSVQDEVLLLSRTSQKRRDHRSGCQPAGAWHFAGTLWFTLHDSHSGIRPAWSDPGDQKRIMTPRQAVDAGADYLVIGRPITASNRPEERQSNGSLTSWKTERSTTD